MSRWNEEFREHPFQARWASLKHVVSSLTADDRTIPTNVQEIARLKKIIAYLDTLIEGVDPELVPSSMWSDFLAQANGCFAQVVVYGDDLDIDHIKHANAHADNLLSYVKPYMVLPKKAAEAATSALVAYQTQVEIALQQVAEIAKDVRNE